MSSQAQLSDPELIITNGADGMVLFCHNKYAAVRDQPTVAVKYLTDTRIDELGGVKLANQATLQEAVLLLLSSRSFSVPGLARLESLYYDHARGVVGFSMEAVPRHIPLRDFKHAEHSDSVKVGVLESLLATLLGLHEIGIAHCDLHNENVLIEVHGHRTVVIDLGRAQMLSEAGIEAVWIDMDSWKKQHLTQLFPESQPTPECITAIRALEEPTIQAWRDIFLACKAGGVCPAHQPTPDEPCDVCANTSLSNPTPSASAAAVRDSASLASLRKLPSIDLR